MKEKKSVLFVSTYPPRACGIATFTQDLVSELQKKESTGTGVVAVSDTRYDYPPEVVHEINQNSMHSYTEAARWINRSGAALVMIEHEYGIYGGTCGGYLLELVRNLEIPYAVTLHTVLPEPEKIQRNIIQSLASGSFRIVTMCPRTVQTLQSIYGVEQKKITVIHHGVPEIVVPGRDELKKAAGMEKRFIVSTFGLISPGKGLEYGIEAVSRAAKTHPEILYLILGRTHPVVQKKYGEKYRMELENLVAACRAENNVRFINRYLTKEEVIRYLSLSDIYMTPYLGKDQAVSGTLAYAVGYGRVIVSTPYIYARSMLADGRGLLADFRSAQSLADCILTVLEHPEKQKEMERKTLEFGRQMRWYRVAEAYRRLFSQTGIREIETHAVHT